MKPYFRNTTVARTGIAYVLCMFFCSACTGQTEQAGTGTDSAAEAAVEGMIYVPAGPFIMGTDDPEAKNDTRPQHTVSVDGFYLDRYETTNRQYREFVIATGYRAPFFDASWARDFNWNGSDYPHGRGDYPVVLVSWHDACAYAAWMGKRLPTEAEWEKAARSGLTSQPFPYGQTIGFSQANFYKGLIRGKKISPVGAHRPNSFGLYDMAGNVWEWCHDWYHEAYYSVSPGNNPSGPDDGFYRVFRGGSWMNDKKFLTCYYRGRNVPDYKSTTVGFRCAMTPVQ